MQRAVCRAVEQAVAVAGQALCWGSSVRTEGGCGQVGGTGPKSSVDDAGAGDRTDFDEGAHGPLWGELVVSPVLCNRAELEPPTLSCRLHSDNFDYQTLDLTVYTTTYRVRQLRTHWNGLKTALAHLPARCRIENYTTIKRSLHASETGQCGLHRDLQRAEQRRQIRQRPQPRCTDSTLAKGSTHCIRPNKKIRIKIHGSLIKTPAKSHADTDRARPPKIMYNTKQYSR